MIFFLSIQIYNLYLYRQKNQNHTLKVIWSTCLCILLDMIDEALKNSSTDLIVFFHFTVFWNAKRFVFLNKVFSMNEFSIPLGLAMVFYYNLYNIIIFWKFFDSVFCTFWLENISMRDAWKQSPNYQSQTLPSQTRSLECWMFMCMIFCWVEELQFLDVKLL